MDLVHRALAASPEVFDSTVLFLNYDENDGFFDHVPPPSPPAGTPGEFLDGTPFGLGFRVPMVVMSPWTRGGWVSSEVFDHTSVLRFMETWTTALGTPATCPNISAWRRKVTGDLTGVFDFARPVYGMPSGLPATEVIGYDTCGPLPNPAPQTNALPSQEPGTRPARALPYQPNGNLDHFEFGAAGKILAWFSMANQGSPARSAAHLSIHPNAYRDTTPWQYTVDAGGTATDFFNIGAGYGAGAYDITMAGPNRFLRRFTGDATKAGKAIEVAARFAVESGTGKTAIWFRMTNSGSAAAQFTITSNNYRSDGPWNYTVPMRRLDGGLLQRRGEPERLVRLHDHVQHGHDVVPPLHGPHRDRRGVRQRLIPGRARGDRSAGRPHGSTVGREHPVRPTRHRPFHQPTGR